MTFNYVLAIDKTPPCNERLSSEIQLVHSTTTDAVNELYAVEKDTFFGIKSVDNKGSSGFKLRTTPTYHNKNFTVIADVT